MGAPLTLVLVSGFSALFLFVLFRREQARGLRYGERIRSVFDRVLTHVHARFIRSSLHVSGRAMRQSIHFIFHQILTAILRFIGRLEERVRSIVHLNKKKAKLREKAASSHFAAVKEHKRSAQLSEHEQREKKDEALSGR